MIQRTTYLNKLISNMNNGFPKVITGIRRCGKSYLLEVIFKEYLLSKNISNKDIIIIDLEEHENFKFRDPFVLLDFITDLSKDGKNKYVIIDEIQNVVPMKNLVFTQGRHIKAKDNEIDSITFTNVILSLSKIKNIDLYVTGSNSRLLSVDVLSSFRDKAININVSPLSFEEYFNYSKIDAYTALNTYLVYGGMPLAVLKNSVEEKIEYLKSLFETTYIKDILERYRFRKNESLDELSILLATCNGTFINSERLVTRFEMATDLTIRKETINSYINAFKDSNIVREVPRYDVKGKSIISSTKKYYFVDPGLRNARLNFAFFDEGQMLENIVYNELIYNGYTVCVGTYDVVSKNSQSVSVRKSYEIDFLASKGNRQFYIQVCSDMSSNDVVNREIRPYVSLNDNIEKIIVINKPIPRTRDSNGINIIGISEFLLDFIK